MSTIKYKVLQVYRISFYPIFATYLSIYLSIYLSKYIFLSAIYRNDMLNNNNGINGVNSLITLVYMHACIQCTQE